MLIVGLTGGIGSGKTTVANIFAELGVHIIDTDIIARELVEPGQPALKKIVEYFGDHILKNDGQLDRKKLAEITFKNNTKRKALETILHPGIKEAMLATLKTIKAPYCITVIPLLLETKQEDLVDRILVVDCDPDDQVKRVKNRDQRNEEQIQSIINSQISRNSRLNAATDIIKNTGNMQDLHDNVVKLHKKYLELGT